MRVLPLLVLVLVVVPSSSRSSSQGSAVGTAVTNAPARTRAAGTFFAVSVQESLATALPTLKAREYVHGIFKTGVIVTDFDGLLARLRAGAVEIAYGPFPARDTQRANLIVRDPEGNLIQFFGSAPGRR